MNKLVILSKLKKNKINIKSKKNKLYCSNKNNILSQGVNCKKDVIINKYNTFSINVHPDHIDKHNYSDCFVGYNLFSWPSWKELIINNSRHDISKLPKEFIFFPLGIIIREDNNEVRDFRKSICKIIEAIREKNKNIYIIFRPHPTTDMEELNILFKSINLKNFIISYINPIILIKHCNFVVRYGASMLDSRVFEEGKYLIRYFYTDLANDMIEELNYDKKLYNKKNFIDIIDEAELKNVIQKTLKDNKSRDISNNFILDEKESIKRILNYIN